MEAWTNWCEGFLGGMMWIFYRHTQTNHGESGPSTTRRLIEDRKTDRNVPRSRLSLLVDLERLVRTFTGDAAINQVVVNAGKTMGLRFNERGDTCARSWRKRASSSTS